MPQHHRGLVADDVQQSPRQLVRGEPRQALAGQGRHGPLVRVGSTCPPHLGHLGQQRELAEPQDLRHFLPTELEQRQERVLVIENLAKPFHGHFRIEKRRTATHQRLLDLGAGDATPGPVSPGDRRGLPPLRPQAPRERVEERVARRVVALAGDPECAADRREQHECRQVQVTGQLVQVQRTADLGPQRAVDQLRGQGAHQPVMQRSRAVDHGGQRVLPRDLGQHTGEVVPVCDVT